MPDQHRREGEKASALLNCEWLNAGCTNPACEWNGLSCRRPCDHFTFIKPPTADSPQEQGDCKESNRQVVTPPQEQEVIRIGGDSFRCVNGQWGTCMTQYEYVNQWTPVSKREEMILDYITMQAGACEAAGVQVGENLVELVRARTEISRLTAEVERLKGVVDAVGRWYRGETKGQDIVDAYEEYGRGGGLRPVPGFPMIPDGVMEQVREQESARRAVEEKGADDAV